MEIENEIHQLVDEYFTDSDYKVVDIILRGEKGTKVLEIFVDNKEGINIDDLTKFNKELNELIDEKIILNDLSKIVVSSPGAERPIKFFWQLCKHAGRDLEIELNNEEKIEGKLITVSDAGDEIIFVEITHREKGKKVVTEMKEMTFKEIKELKIKISFSKNKKIKEVK
ncbi:MAG: hypothetical protein M3R36_18895 [Bacteroidota bacterium]|nr:hypothetical protein [Bacteroidota bacterium]